MFKKIVLGLVLGLFWLTPAFAKNPVLLVHGTNANSEMWETGCLKKTLKNAGFDVFTLADLFSDFPDKGQGFIQEDIKHLKKVIDKITKGQPGTKVDIIAHSRGGLVAELYTMMYGDQYKPKMDYTYIDANKKPRKKIITDLPRYGNDINQIIMLGTPNKGSGWSDFARWWLWGAKKAHEMWNLPDPWSVAVEQQRTSGSNFMELFGQNNLNSNVRYLQIAEDRIFGGDGVDG
jgi:pimeloyl-ACP methyl ester carboxylesterase